MENRIKLNDDLISAVAKMSDGNPGGMTACMELLQNSEKYDPQNFMGGFGNILLLDTFGIYGTDIYVLWSDICGRDIGKTITVLRGAQLGILPVTILTTACGKQDYSGRDMINIEDLYTKVKEKMPEFDPENLILFEVEN